MRNLKIVIAVMLFVSVTGCTNNIKNKEVKTTTDVETTTKEEKITLVDGENILDAKPISKKVKGKVTSLGTNSDYNYVLMKLEDGTRVGLLVDGHLKVTWEEDLDEEICKNTFRGKYFFSGLGETELVEINLTQELTLDKEFKELIDYEDVKKWYWADSAHVLELNEYAGIIAAKPVVYLYPEKTMDVNVQLDYKGRLTTTYPAYPKNGWNVTAKQDGTVIDKTTKKEYSYLFWEGEDSVKYDMSEGFVVAGKDTAEFLQDKLSYMGLTPKEYNEFIVYWLPKMQDNPYNLIKFQGKQYTENAKLRITPRPDSMLRVFMTWKALDKKIDIKEQNLSTFERKGFTVVEWGGSEIKE